MEVRIRRADDMQARVLADIPFRPEAIDSVIPMIASWGVVDSDGTLQGEEALSGQFVDDGTHAYFEVVIEGE